MQIPLQVKTTVWAIMRVTVTQILIIGTLAITAHAHRVSGQEILERKVSVSATNKSLKKILADLEASADISFVFSEKAIQAGQRTSITAAGAKLADVLTILLSPLNIDFEEVGGQIVLSRTIPASLTLSEAGENGRPDLEMMVSGVITDENGNALPGVNVLVKGTTIGTTSDVNGQYSLDAQEPSAILVFSFIGYLSKEVGVEGRSQVNVQLAPDVQTLSEVVVIGYGTREKKDLTGAVSQIDAKEITRQVNMSPEMAMQGRMAGVFVSNPGSNPTARPEIRIRGVGTLGFNDPLYVVDGIPITEGGASNPAARTQDQRGPINIFAMINPNDIESISVLKDASATAIYGVRASNGVILITTKRGKEGATRVDFAASYGIQNIKKRYDMTNVQDYTALVREAWDNNTAQTQPAGLFRFYDETNPEYLGDSPSYERDWVDAGFVDNAAIQDYSVSISGGNGASNYSVGVGYTSQENAVFSSQFDRYSLNINSDHKIGKWLTLGESYRLVYSENEEQSGGGFDNHFVAPWQPLYDPENINGRNGWAYASRTIDGAFVSQGYGAGTRNNYRGIAEYRRNERSILRNMGSVYAELSPFKGFRVRGTFSADYYTNTRQLYEEADRGLFEATGAQGRPYITGNTYSRRLNENVNLVGEFLIGYTTTINKHNLDIVLNAMDQKVYWNNTQASISPSLVPSWDQRRIEEGWPALDKGLLYERTRSGLQGYMARASYHYDSKYYFDATVRRDGSSKFGPGYKWGTFPSFAAAWRVSSEPFMQGISVLSDLKFRAGWGRIGNQETRDYAFLANINVNPKAAFGIDPTNPGSGVIYDAAVLGNFPTPDLSWETVTTTNVGVDGELWQGKLSFTAEYYHRLTDGILQTIPVPLVIGALQSPVVNLAKITNQGFELQANLNQKIGDVVFTAGLNLTTVKNRVNSIYNGIPTGGNENRVQEGYPVNFIWGYRTDGIFQTPDEVADWLGEVQDPGRVAQKSPGDVRFLDVSGTPTPEDPEGAYQSQFSDGRIDAFDQVYLGKTIPGYFYGINLGANWKNFDVYLNFRGTGDVQKVFRLGLESANGGGGNFHTDYLGRWTAERPSTTIPRAIQGDPSGNNRFNDRFVHDASFIRLQNFQIGYTLPPDLLSRLGMRSLRTYISGANLLVLSGFPDLDPENNTTPTVYTVGVNVGL